MVNVRVVVGEQNQSAGDLVSVDGSENTVEGLAITSAEDTSDWSASDWDTRTSNCMGVSGTRQTIRNNVCLNVNFGISVGAVESLLEGNLVENSPAAEIGPPGR